MKRAGSGVQVDGGLKKGRYTDEVNGQGRRCKLVWAAFLLACLVPGRSDGQVLDIISIINAAVKKVIVAADLEVEQIQTQTIGLQNTQKAEQNDMEQSELTGIAGWVEDQRQLFAAYYQELREVKAVIATCQQVRQMISQQAAIVAGVQQSWTALQQDKHFSAAELSHAYAVLSGMVTESEQNIKRLTAIVTSLLTTMDDAARLSMVDETALDINRNYSDLVRFSQQNELLSLQRAQDENDMNAVKALYGIP